ncbi:MAG: hypothetical protein SWH68_11750 [Thermodesulfobacteriota bacterium]|nr:hypothetical protein [Thermodesulfobacteriota bacterium]
MQHKRSSFQTLWAGLLVVAGVGVFLRTFQQGSTLDSIAGDSTTAFFIHLCFYIMGILLIGGGVKKFLTLYRQPASSKNKPGIPADTSDEDHPTD